MHFAPWWSIFPVDSPHIFPAPEGSPFLTVILTVKLARLGIPRQLPCTHNHHHLQFAKKEEQGENAATKTTTILFELHNVHCLANCVKAVPNTPLIQVHHTKESSQKQWKIYFSPSTYIQLKRAIDQFWAINDITGSSWGWAWWQRSSAWSWRRGCCPCWRSPLTLP